MKKIDVEKMNVDHFNLIGMVKIMWAQDPGLSLSLYEEF
jgi:hypothetical protein